MSLSSGDVPGPDDVEGWKTRLRRLCDDLGLVNQTDSDIERLMKEAKRRGRSYADLAKRLEAVAASTTTSTRNGSAPAGTGSHSTSDTALRSVDSASFGTFVAGQSGSYETRNDSSSVNTWTPRRSSQAATSTYVSATSAPESSTENSISHLGVPSPPPGTPMNDEKFWFDQIRHFVDAHPRMTLREGDTDHPDAVVLTEQAITDFMEQCAKRHEPYVSLYHRLRKRFGPLPSPGEYAATAKIPEKQVSKSYGGAATARTETESRTAATQPAQGVPLSPRVAAAGGPATTAGVDDPEEVQMLLRLRRFCKHHKLKQSDNELERMMRETKQRGEPLENLMKQLVAKFGKEPADPDTEQQKKKLERQNTKQKLYRFMTHHQLDASDETLEALLTRTEDKGKSYEFLFNRLSQKYGDVPKEALEESQAPAIPIADVYTGGMKRSGSVQAVTGIPHLTRREIAAERLKNFARYYQWSHSAEDLERFLDETAEAHGDRTYESLFRRLTSMYGPEPPLSPHYSQQLQTYRALDVKERSPINAARTNAGYSGDTEDMAPDSPPSRKAYDIFTDADALRTKVKSKLRIYCRHYKLHKSESDLERLMKDFETAGWDVMFMKMEKKFGPVPWPQYEHTLLMREIQGAAGKASTNGTNNRSRSSGSDGHPSLLDISQRDKLRLLSRFNETYNIGWSHREMDRMIETMGEGSSRGPSFADLISALERKYGTLPDESPERRLLEPMDLEAERTLQRLGVTHGFSKSMATLARPSKEEDERIFWRDRIKAYLDHYAPEESFSVSEVEKLMLQFKRDRTLSGQESASDHDIYAEFWQSLLARYGPEPAVGPTSYTAPDGSPTHTGDDPTQLGSLRRYWYQKFKTYCDYYNIKKTPSELEKMLANYREKGWARMYDQLCDLHGPPPPIMPTTQRSLSAVHSMMSPEQKPSEPLTKNQWKNRIRQYCTAKFPGKTPAELTQIVNQMCDPKVKGLNDVDAANALESLFESLVLLAGPPGSKGNGSDAIPLTPARSPAARQSPTIVIHFSGLDPGLYQLAPVSAKQRFARAIESDLTASTGLMDVTEAKVVDLRPSGPDCAVDIHIAPTVDSRAVGDALINSVSNGAFRLAATRASYVEDLGGEAAYLRATSAALTETRQTPNHPAASITHNPLDSSARSGEIDRTGKLVAGQGVYLTGVQRRQEGPVFYGEDAPQYRVNTSAAGDVQPAPPMQSSEFVTASWASPRGATSQSVPRSREGSLNRSGDLPRTPLGQSTLREEGSYRSNSQGPTDMYGFSHAKSLSGDRTTSPGGAVAYSQRRLRVSETPQWPRGEPPSL